MAESSNLTFGYWNLRGTAGVARNLLAYTELPFTNKIYTTKAEWFDHDIHNLDFEYPDLPYLIDGDNKITGSDPIAMYIPVRAGKKELIGDTDQNLIEIRTAFETANDLKLGLKYLAFTKSDLEKQVATAFTSGDIRNKLELFEKSLEGKDWLVDNLSIADFSLFEALELISAHDPEKLVPYSNLVAFMKRFGEIPTIKAHRQSDKHIKGWFPAGSNKWESTKNEN